MPAPYDYSSASGYARTRADWTDFPSTTTPITQAQLDQWDQAIFDKKTEIFNVGDFGVLPANSAATNNTNFGNLLSAVTAGGVIQFNNGSYAFSTAITPPRVSQKGVVIRGVGAGLPGTGGGATTITYTGSNYCFNFGAGTVSDYAAYQGLRDLKIDLSGSGTPTGAVRFNSALYCGLHRVSILGPTGGTKTLVYFDPGDGSYGNYHNRIYNCAFQGQTSASDIGIKLHSTTGNGANANFVRDSWFGVFNQSVLIDGGDSNHIEANEFNGTTTTAVKLQSANTNANKIIDNQFDGATTSINIGASVSSTIVADNTGDTAYVNDGADTRSYNNAAVWTGSGTFADYFASITAAAALPLPGGIEARKVIRVDGTAAITSITGARPGTMVTLHFTGTAAAAGVTDGGTLKLAGNFAYTPDDTLTLFFDGTNWFEISRSVN